MKKLTILSVLFLLALAGLERAHANDIDTVWMRWMPANHSVSSVRFSPDNQKIAAFSAQNNAVAIVNVSDGTIDTLLRGFNWGDYTPDGQFIISFKGRLIYKISTSDYSYTTPFDSAIGNINSISISNNGFIVCKIGNGFQVWNMNNGDIIYTKTFIEPDNEGNTGYYLATVKITKDGNYLIICLSSAYKDFKGESHCLKLYSEFYNLNTFEKNNEVKNTMDIFCSNTGKYVAFDYQDCEVSQKMASFVYDFELNETIMTVPGISSKPEIAFSPDDRYLAVAYESKTGIEIWDIVLKKIVYNYLRNPLGSYLSVGASHDGKLIVAGTNARLYLYKSYWSNVSVPENTINATITYPNPVMDTFQLEFDLTSNNITMIDLVDLTGNSVKKIENQFMPVGHYLFNVNITELPSGIYTLRIISGIFNFNSSIIKN